MSRCHDWDKRDAPELYAAFGKDLRKARGPAADLYLSLDGGRRKLLPNDFLPPGTLTARSVTLIEQSTAIIVRRKESTHERRHGRLHHQQFFRPC